MKNIIQISITIFFIVVLSTKTGFCYFLHDQSHETTPEASESNAKNSKIFSPPPKSAPASVPAQPAPLTSTILSSKPSEKANETAVSSALKEFSAAEEPILWKLAPGSLQQQLTAWADKVGYKVVWRASWDLDMQTSATFSGDFQAAVTELFLGLHDAGHPIRLAIYPANKVLEVIDN